jgi:HlyD family secretion protein
MSQNVVTYVVEIATDNKDGVLLPYLTANVRFIKASRTNVLTVSNAALRFQPEPGMVAPEFAAQFDELMSLRGGERLLWKQSEVGLVPVKVKVGLASSGETEIISGDVNEGDEVVNGTVTAAPETSVKSAQGGSPFMPKMPQFKRRNLNPGRTKGTRK